VIVVLLMIMMVWRSNYIILFFLSLIGVATTLGCWSCSWFFTILFLFVL